MYISLSIYLDSTMHYRHAAVNILYRTLASAHIPSRLEPSDLNRLDGKRPDGVTMIPWKNGRMLVWDVTCPYTFAPSYRCHATSSAGAVATLAEERKASKYSCLVPSHSFTPVAIESGANGGKDASLPEGAEPEGTATYWRGSLQKILHFGRSLKERICKGQLTAHVSGRYLK